MTTKPRVRKFRVRRSPATRAAPDSGQSGRSGQAPGPREAAQGQAQGQAQARQPRQLNAMEEAALEAQEDGFGAEPFPTAAAAGATAGADAKAARATRAAQVSAAPSREEELAAIRKEGLTGRQLRMARRVAARHGLPATSDYDAVRLLRRAGIDPFQRSTMLELVSAEGEAGAASAKGKGGPAAQLPQVVGDKQPQLPSKDVMDAASRAKSIMEIQLDIARRRRRKILLLLTRLAFFVLLPTLIAGYYYFNIATPMYATRSEFIIQKADAGGGSGLSGLFSGSGLATSQDSITVQSYLTSRDAMLRLDEEVGFKAHFSNPEIDPIQRLPEGASNEDAYRLYKRNVKIGYDPSEGIIKMEVIAADPEMSVRFSEALIRYAEERVDHLTQRKREDQMKGARESYEEAEAKMLAAQQEVLRLQEEMGVLDATSESAAIMGQINGFEVQLLEKKLQLAQLEANPRPNQARVEGVRGDIRRLEGVIAELRAKLTEGDGASGNGSLAAIQGKLAVAQTNMETRILLMQQALQQLETARIEANKQTRYLELGVRPVAPDEATYPRALENTILAFLIFAGIYLMISLTASILREQISS